MGSPPLTRGKHRAFLFMTRFVRITPAHAGKTHMSSCIMPRSEDHPRSRGENEAKGKTPSMKRGSPPLTRGKPLSAKCFIRPVGITPAHAGKTFLPVF